jgi:hypothetical protein
MSYVSGESGFAAGADRQAAHDGKGTIEAAQSLERAQECLTNGLHPLAPSWPGAGLADAVAVFCARTEGVKGAKQSGDLLLRSQGVGSQPALSDKLRPKIAEIHRSSQTCGSGAVVRVAHIGRLPW